MQNSNSQVPAFVNNLFEIDYWRIVERLSRFTFDFCRAVVNGVRYRTIPWVPCFVSGALGVLFVRYHYDAKLVAWLGIGHLYPRFLYYSSTYRLLALLSGVILWGIIQVGRNRRRETALRNIFESIGLKNALGVIPEVVGERKINETQSTIVLRPSFIPLSEFKKRRASLEEALGAYITRIDGDRNRKWVEITYSRIPFSSFCELSEGRTKQLNVSEFIVGENLEGQISSSLNEAPHLLVAGETGGGKSTFLKQMITSLYVNDPTIQLYLIDLKGGLEFNVFRNLHRVSVLGNIEDAINALKDIPDIINKRAKLLKATGKSNIAGMEEEFPRYVVVLDEAAEFFLASGGTANDRDVGREILSRVARQGRSLGIHLVVATQRPDSRALDPQIKANLTGVVCFRMVNDASSISVIGNGRATEIDDVPGRALWKRGANIVEVQTPLMEDATLNELLTPFRVSDLGPGTKALMRTATPSRYQPLQ